jgi:hypothetical protein
VSWRQGGTQQFHKEKIRMKKFFHSGAAFMVVALLCLAVGFIEEDKALFTIIGAFWLIMVIIVRSRNANKPPPGDRS